MESKDEAWFDAEASRSAEGRKILLEQYRLYVDTSAHVSDRRGTANNFFMSVNTALVAIHAAIPGAQAESGIAEHLSRLAILAAGVTACLGWFALIRSYRLLNRAKFAVIAEVEQRLPARLFEQEWHQLTQRRNGRYPPLTFVEQLVPAIFALIYLVLLAAELAG